MPIDLHAQFPTLSSVVGAERLKSKLAALERRFRDDRRELIEARRRYSRGFWNTAATAAFGTENDWLEAALFRLRTIEHGLEQAVRCGKHSKFSDTLTKDDDGFHQAIAELHVLARLAPLAPSIDMERPGQKLGKNYDLHLAMDGIEIHLDCKWRTSSPIGEATWDAVLDIPDLLGSTFNVDCYIALRENLLGDDTRIEVATIVDEARKAHQAHKEDTESLDAEALSRVLSGPALNAGLEACLKGQRVFAVTIDGITTAYVPEERTFYLDHRVVDHIEFGEALDPAQRGSCLLIPHAESRPVHTKATRDAWEATSVKPFDVQNPENQGISDLIDEVHLQLPVAPFNVVCIGVEHQSSFDDCELALLGEPVPDPNGIGGVHRRGGLFEEAKCKTISGAIAFTLVYPTMPSAGPPIQHATFWPNPNCVHRLPAAVATRLVEALQGTTF